MRGPAAVMLGRGRSVVHSHAHLITAVTSDTLLMSHRLSRGHSEKWRQADTGSLGSGRHAGPMLGHAAQGSPVSVRQNSQGSLYTKTHPAPPLRPQSRTPGMF